MRCRSATCQAAVPQTTAPKCRRRPERCSAPSLAPRVPMGLDCISPARHSAFSSPIEMMHFIGNMRSLSGGKPTGFKLCVGHPWEFLAARSGDFHTDLCSRQHTAVAGFGALAQFQFDHFHLFAACIVLKFLGAKCAV